VRVGKRVGEYSRKAGETIERQRRRQRGRGNKVRRREGGFTRSSKKIRKKEEKQTRDTHEFVLAGVVANGRDI